MRYTIPQNLNFLSSVEEHYTLKLVNVTLKNGKTIKMYYFRYFDDEILMNVMDLADHNRLDYEPIVLCEDPVLSDFVVAKYAFSMSRSPETGENAIPISAISVIDRAPTVGDLVDVFTVREPPHHPGLDNDDHWIGELKTGVVTTFAEDGDTMVVLCRSEDGVSDDGDSLTVKLTDPNWQYSSLSRPNEAFTPFIDYWLYDPAYGRDFETYSRRHFEVHFTFTEDSDGAENSPANDARACWYRNGRVFSQKTRLALEMYEKIDDLRRILNRSDA